MSAGRSSDPRTPEERAEEFMERFTADASRRLTRFMGRAREEIEDIVAEARSLKESQVGGPPHSGSKAPSRPRAASKR